MSTEVTENCVPTSHEITEFGPFRLNASERLLLRNGVAVDIGSRSLDLLIALVERAGEVLSRRELIARAWPGLVVDEANVRVNVANLRKCLGEGVNGARYIVNVQGRGYSFVAATTRVRVDSSVSLPRLVDQSSASRPTFEHSLPERLTRLIGRDDSIAELVELFAQHRFVSIVGPGGMGKTTVAISVAHRMLQAFDGAVYFVDLGSLADAALIPGTIAAVLGLKVQSQDPRASVLAFLVSRRALLVLDNCEHLIEKAAELAEWLHKSTSQVHLLATSREALRVEGERVYILPPLEIPPPVDGLTAADALSFPAVQLFMERAAAAGANEQLTNEVAALAGEICRKMDGIALAIELAAGRVRSHGVRGTAELLNNRFNLLMHGRRSAPPRHQTLQAMLDWSYNLLHEEDRRVLYRLSVFVGPFELSAAQWVAGDAALDEADVAAAIASLIDKSLISSSVQNGTSYLRLLDTTRAYASTKLARSGELQTVSRKLVEYLIARLTGCGATVNRNALDRDLVQIGSVRGALGWAFGKSGDSGLGVQLAALAAPLLLEMSLLEDCHHWCHLALLRLGAKAGSSTHLVLQEALAISAMFTRGNGADVRESIEHGLRLAQALNDQRRELSLLAGLHIYLTRIGDFTGAVDVARRSIQLARRIESSEGIVMSEWMLGCAFHLIGDQAGALRHTEEAFKQAAARGVTTVDLFGYGHRTRALIVLARALWLTGSVDRAVQVARQAVKEAELSEQPINRCIAKIYSATVFLWRGDIEEAEELVSRLIHYATRHGLGPYVAVGTALSGDVALLKGDCWTAVGRLREALTSLHAERHHVVTTALSRSMAEALLRCDEIVEAEAMIAAALERAEAQHGAFDMPELLRTRAEIGIVSGRLNAQTAEAMLRRSIELANSQSALSLELRAAMAWGQLLAGEARVQEAYAVLSECYERFTEGFETRDLKRARQLIETWRRG